MSPTVRDDERLQTDLAELRAALRDVQAPPLDETALRARFRAAAQQRAAAATAADGRSGWRMHLAAAAVVVLAIGAAVTAVLLRVELPEPMPVAADAPAAAAPVGVAAFQPLSNAPGLSSTSAYSVVRVRIPLSAFALVPGTEQEGTVEAELLVGEDGLARAIRFNGADPLAVSVADQ